MGMTEVERAMAVRRAMPASGLFAGQTWRVAPRPVSLSAELVEELVFLGRVLHRFYRAVDLLYRRSVEGKMPGWVAELLDQGKPSELIAWQRHHGFRNELPRVIRPDVLLTDEGFVLSELDSVPGGIGVTQWLNSTYAGLGDPVLGGSDGMVRGFASIFGEASRVNIVVSEESGAYRPEMEYLAGLAGDRFRVVPPDFGGVKEGEAVYRFFELFDVENVKGARGWFDAAAERRIRLTPAPKPVFEEKLLFGLVWNRNLRSFWRNELGEGFLKRLQKVIPYTWILDPTPLPPHAAYPGLDLTDWQQLKGMSQRERDLILKVSGYSPEAWGARGVHLGSDLSGADWSAAVDAALSAWGRSPHLLQRYHKPRTLPTSWLDAGGGIEPMTGRARLCPYYFVAGDGDAARPVLGGVLATVCPADKKIIHGMTDAVLAPCMVGEQAR
jgi:hypothetical protein